MLIRKGSVTMRMRHAILTVLAIALASSASADSTQGITDTTFKSAVSAVLRSAIDGQELAGLPPHRIFRRGIVQAAARWYNGAAGRRCECRAARTADLPLIQLPQPEMLYFAQRIPR